MLSLDHIVFSGSDLQAATKDYGNIPLKTIKGGTHENWGTHNYLAYFANNCYIEWLGIKDFTKADSSANPLIKHLIYAISQNEQGPFQFALRTTKLDAYVDHFQENNIPFVGPVDGERQKPDGSILRWRMLFPTYNYDEETLPFLIEWSETESKRFDVSLINSQTVAEILIGNLSKERYQEIYQLRNRVISRTVRLRNTSIKFTGDGTLSMNVK